MSVADHYWYREAVGGPKARDPLFWNELGALQLRFLKEQQLAPEHRVLEVGCGPFRAGRYLMGYLNEGNYFGLEKEYKFVAAGFQSELVVFDDWKANFMVMVNDDFDLSMLPPWVKIDFAISHSVFTHLVPEQIEMCIRNVVERLYPDGVFFSTFHPGPEIDVSKPLDGDQGWRKGERWLTKYPISFMAEMAERAGAKFGYIGEWGHPDNDGGFQMMAQFTRA